MRVVKRYSWLWIGLLLLITASISMLLLNANNRPSLTTATWIWNAKLISSQTEEIVAFARDNQINLIYLHIEPTGVSPQAYRAFIKQARDANIKVEALGGDPNWAYTANRQSISDLISWVKAYNQTAKAEERFSGIHVDIEPYLLPEWKKDQAKIVNQWLKNVDYLIAETKKDTKLQVSADLPFWIDTVNVPDDTEKVSNWMLQRLDSITLMAYRNHAKGHNGIVDIVEKTVAAANSENKATVIVGVNILESSEGSNVSFHEEGTHEMKQQLVILQEELAGNPAFAGSAIHDYESWKHATQREEQL
ncbi:hypothetical protein BRE01_19960 [Brevibacillus reuszeri]|uniref:Amidase n=1 Tax=Brevibacillus reuszeri TaxID=54915 RepID=A0A0K9YXB0_9BACL|nr:hypothetical protein [Brevibacillus reuszeri]KNB73333.1 hypothetical protein ADS79_05065 [Brevibacillus reuszeri]MED1856954.1 hypothetical protein [Brevibacillus reuszeri]GED68294.1 hypothetical protein BRE01_19960 [Brevibacillus reuszeri]